MIIIEKTEVYGWGAAIRGWRGLFEVKDNSFNASAPKSNNTVPSEDDYEFERGSFWK